MKKKPFTIMMGSIALAIAAIAIVGNILAFGTFDPVLTSYFGVEGATETSFKDNQYFERKYENAKDASDRADEISKEIEAEGAVLLKNDNSALPLAENSSVSMFSVSSVNFYSGKLYGSGAINSDGLLTLGQTLENANLKVNKTLENFYISKKNQYSRKIGGLNQGTSKTPYKWGINEVPYSEYTSEVIASYKNYNDAAIVVITREGAENGDLPRDMSEADPKNTGHILELDYNEKKMMEEVCKNFKKVIVLLNTTNTFELGFLDEYNIDACIWVGNVGLGMKSVGQIIAGEINPSGRTVDTYAYDLFSSPAMQNMGNYAYVNGSNETTGHYYLAYAEGIYIGYKYYETRYEDKVLNQGNAGNYNYDEVVQFPFGYGLSYTTFEWFDYSSAIKGDNIEVNVTVKNTGKIAGKDVVEVYYQSPYTAYDIKNKVEKASVNLGGIGKTKLLKAGESETITVSFPINDMKSYDSNNKKTYIFEAGDYYVTAATNAHNAINNILKEKGNNVDGNSELASKHNIKLRDVSKDDVTEVEIKNLFDDAKGDVKYLSRNNWSAMDNNGLLYGTAFGKDSDGPTYKHIIDAALKKELDTKGYAASGAPNEEFVEPTVGAKTNRKLIEFRGKDFNDHEWDELLNQVRKQEMVQMAKSSGHHTYAMPSVGKPYTTDSDGPSAWKPFIGDGISSGGLPGEIVHASTWNKKLAYEIGEIMGELCLWAKIEGKDTNPNLTGWYAPAMNIHRTPFGGRNFEYYSEDATLSAIIGSEVVKGATEKGVVTYIKHFAMNEQEANRMTDNVTWTNEQALREIYLRPFEVSIKEGKSLGLMSSYNRVGKVWSGGNYNLITGVLRTEWGFNGFVITDYMDGDYEDIDQMLAAGGDAALYSLNDKHLTLSGAQALTYLRRATKHCLYAFANSNAMNGISSGTVIIGGTPIYHRYIIIIDVILGIALLATLGSIPLKLLLARSNDTESGTPPRLEEKKKKEKPKKNKNVKKELLEEIDQLKERIKSLQATLSENADVDDKNN